jgi:hypothetical protein
MQDAVATGKSVVAPPFRGTLCFAAREDAGSMDWTEDILCTHDAGP